VTAVLPKLSEQDAVELACRAHLGVWAERKRGFTHAPLHWEWCELAMTRNRLCVVAPREHAKTETFTVNQIAWRCIYEPGIWAYVFAQTADQAGQWKERIDKAIGEVAPWMIAGEHGMNTRMSIYANWSKVEAAGAGKSVRGSHPDLVVGDDVLEEGNCMTAMQRKRMERWWFGTVGGMAHPAGVSRTLGGSDLRVTLPATKIHLVGTPFHQQDLLMGMRTNPVYEFRRYAAEFDPVDLVPGTTAVEVRA
jgi:hypothetical protein